MKVLTFVLAALAIGCPNFTLSAHGDLVKIYYKGSDILAKQLVKGDLSLYVSHHSDVKRVTGPMYRKRKTVFVKRYYLQFQNQIARISPYNYKKVLRQFLPHAPELHARIGRPGFRYPNTPSIVRYYNTFRVPVLEEGPAFVPETETDRK